MFAGLFLLRILGPDVARHSCLASQKKRPAWLAAASNGAPRLQGCEKQMRSRNDCMRGGSVAADIKQSINVTVEACKPFGEGIGAADMLNKKKAEGSRTLLPRDYAKAMDLSRPCRQRSEQSRPDTKSRNSHLVMTRNLSSTVMHTEKDRYV